MSEQLKVDAVRRVLGKAGQVHVTLGTPNGDMTLDLDEAGAETLAVLLSSVLRDTRRANYDPSIGTSHEVATAAGISSAAGPGALGLDERLVLMVVGQGATKITLNLDAEMADKLVADAEARAVRNRGKTRN